MISIEDICNATTESELEWMMSRAYESAICSDDIYAEKTALLATQVYNDFIESRYRPRWNNM